MILLYNMNKYINIHKSLHIKYSISKFQDKWLELTLTHTEIVSKIAIMIISKLKILGIDIDEELVLEGISLHDIGIYQTFDEEFHNNIILPKYIHHGELGYKIILEELGNLKLARIALSHTGIGGIRKDEIPSITGLTLPTRIQITLEEELISWADKFHSKYPKFVNIEQIEKDSIKYGKHELFSYFLEKFGYPNTSELEKEYASWHNVMDKFIESISQNMNIPK